MRKVLLFMLFCWSGFFVGAQDTLFSVYLEENYELIPIKNFPVGDFDLEASEMLLAIHTNSESLAYILKYTEDGETAYRKLIEFTSDQLEVPFINRVKMYSDPEFINNSLSICYGMPFKATEICILFSVQKGQISFNHSTMEDLSADAIEMAEAALDSNNVGKAAELYNGVMYPSSYLNEDEVAGRLMKKAHDNALKAYKLKNYTLAKTSMEEPFLYYLNQYYISIEKVDEFKERVLPEDESNSEYWNLTTFKRWVGDYGLFLYLAKDLPASEIINKYLTTMLPEVAGPYLQLADTYFDMGKKEEAKKWYQKYCSLMKEQKKEKQIPKRAQQRK